MTAERLEILRQADAIFLDELRDAGLLRSVAQAFAVLLPVQAVGVMGDARTYESVIALRAVETDDFMTADWSRLAPRPAGARLDPDYQCRQGRQSRRLRRDQQAARHDRVGVSGGTSEGNSSKSVELGKSWYRFISLVKSGFGMAV